MHTRARARSQADGRSTCSLRGEWPDRPEPGRSRISAITRASYAILFQLIIRGLLYMPGAASSLISLGPFSTYTADAHLLKCEPLSGEGGGLGLGWHSLCSRLVPGHIILPVLFLQTTQHRIRLTRGKKVFNIKYKFSTTCLIDTVGFWESKVAFYKHRSWQTHFSDNNL